MKNEARTTFLLVGDVVILLISFYAMLFLAFAEITEDILELHRMPFFILSIFWLLIFFIFDLYDTEKAKPTIPHLRQIVLAFIVTTALSVAFFYLIPFFAITPKTNLLIFVMCTFLLFIVWRRIFYTIFSSYFKQEVVFITDGNNNNPYIKDLINYMHTYPQSGFHVAGEYDSVEQFFKENMPSPRIFIVTKEVWKKSENFKKLYYTDSIVLDLAHAHEDILGRIPVDMIDEGWFIYNIRDQDKSIYVGFSRILSTLAAVAVLVATSPILILIAIFIKLYDRGPVFYSQTRIGRDGKEFNLYKFRSMIVNAEKNGAEWSKQKDDRVTPVGRVIRKLHFDEIPQMLNVINGDITLVGPRPERPEFVEKLRKEIPFYYLRHTISPGFTGWAQIKFRYAGNVMDSKKKFEYDLYYLKNRNLFMDLGIIIRTIQIIFTH